MNNTKENTMNVTLLNYMGSDLTVVNAARVSFSKESSYDENMDGTWSLSDKDVKLISYLVKHNHWSPFSHCFLQFRVKAPIFVARQLQKHQVGLAWNEVSRRYVDSEPEFYIPDTWRKRAENVKQGSSDEEVELPKGEYWGKDYTIVDDIIVDITVLYDRLIALGVCPEQARMILPQSMYTEWIWSGSLYAFYRACKLRLDSHTQKETQLVAEMISHHCNKFFPVSWKELMNA